MEIMPASEDRARSSKDYPMLDTKLYGDPGRLVLRHDALPAQPDFETPMTAELLSEEARIRAVFGLPDDAPLPRVTLATLATYHACLRKNLVFPFQALYAEMTFPVRHLVRYVSVLGLLPVIGAFLVYIPAGIILIAQGSVITGIIVLAVGIGVISQIDNFLRPMLMAGRTALHPLLLFVSIMGGVVAFGFTGMVLGPVAAAMFLAMMDMVSGKD